MSQSKFVASHIFIGLLLIANAVIAADLEPTLRFVGTIDGQDPIHMELVRQGNVLKGQYTFDQGDIVVLLRGSEAVPGKFELQGVNNSGQVIGYLNLDSDQSGNLSGEWSSVGEGSLRRHFDLQPSPVSPSEQQPLAASGQSINVPQTQNAPQIGSAVAVETPLPEVNDHGDNSSSTWYSQHSTQLILTTWLAIVIVGVILGVNEKIIIFRNYNDWGIAFLIGIAAVSILIVGALQGGHAQSNYLFSFLSICFIGLLFWFILRVFKDNSNPVFALIALITKTTLSFLFITSLISFITPTGRSAADRAKSRRFGFIFLLLVGPLSYALVREKEGFFSPDNILKRRGLL